MEAGFGAFTAAAETLNPFAVDARYPLGVEVNYSVEQARQALQMAREIGEYVSELIA